MNDTDIPIVLDDRSGLIKVGFAGDRFPHAVFPSILSRPPFQGTRVGMGQMEVYFGYEVHGLNMCTNYPELFNTLFFIAPKDKTIQLSLKTIFIYNPDFFM